MNVRQQVPNILTLANLVFGCIGIVSVYRYPAHVAVYFLWGSCVFDFLDGYAARHLNATSPLGKQLDSLADIVSFGVLPSVLVFTWIDKATHNEWVAYGAFFIAVFSAVRLARYNLDEKQAHSFIGLPSPANALFVTSLIFLTPPYDVILSSSLLLLALVFLSSFMLVAPLRFFSLKFTHYNWRGNQLRIILIGGTIVLLSIKQTTAVPWIMLSYIVLSLVSGRRKNNPSEF